MKIVIGSRGSRLALWQANWVKDQLQALGNEAEILIIKTSGDKLSNTSLLTSGTKGLFIKEIEEALLDGQVNLAVHSLKDLPTEQPEGLVVAAVPEREDPRDVLVLKAGRSLQDLPPGSRVGTGSLRRQAQLRALRPDLEFIPLRGNVDTRLKKLDRGDCEALLLAGAGLKRLGFASRITCWLSESDICPAVGQGALALEVSRKDANVLNAILPLDHPPTHRAVRAERAMLLSLGGGCQLPIGAFTSESGGELRLAGIVADPNGAKVLRSTLSGSPENPETLGTHVAEELLKQGAAALLEFQDSRAE